MSQKFRPYFFLKSLLLIAVFSLSSVFFTSCYVLNQGFQFLSDRSKARSIDDIKKDPKTDRETLDFLAKVDDIRSFGVNRLGLAQGDQYTTFIKTEKDYVVTVVSACDELAFDTHTWTFPFVGTIPYLGFFREDEALGEAKNLKEKGLDVWVRRVDAFSTLGVFKDPLYSYMRAYPLYRLSDMLLHEMLHATIWSKDFSFNEQLAVFCGEEAAKKYLLARYGEDSPEYREYLDSKADNEVFYADIANIRARLEEVYASDAGDDEKRASKNALIEEFKASFAPGSGEEPYRYRNRGYERLAKVSVNNAYIDLFHTYTGKKQVFTAVYERLGGDWDRFLETMKLAAKTDAPFSYLEKEFP